LDIAKQCIPTRKVNIRPSEPPWINSIIKSKIRKRKRLYRKAKLTDSDDHWKRFKQIRNEIVDLVKKAKTEHIEKLSSKLKSDLPSTKSWWSTLKRFINSNSNVHIPPLQNNGNIAYTNEEKTNIFNDFFHKQTLLADSDINAPVLEPLCASKLESLLFTPEEVHDVLVSLPLGKASGPDMVNNRLLKELSKELSTPLCKLFNFSIDSATVPASWKLAHVSPIFKSGDPSLVSNYRPISLLSNIDKVFERLIFKHLYNHFHDNSILTPFQSGFIPGDSTVNQLTFLYNSFCKALDQGKEVRVIFCDISKAFDRVWHNGLISKLKASGVDGKLLSWFQNYLSDRKQKVVLSGTYSYLLTPKAGVPQGSILGPLLFLLYINDIVVDIQANIRLFADDTSLYIVVDDPVQSAITINSDIDKITSWADTWLVNFNPVKTESLIISRKRNKPNHPPLYMKQQQIKEVISHKHLGIFLSNNCSWHSQFEYMTAKAWKRINIMRKLKFTIDRKSLETIYISFVRPILEYGDIIWSNCTKYEKDELEKIQLEAARIATGATKLVSRQFLYDETGWEPLENRRLQHCLILFYKMVNNITPSYLSSLIPNRQQSEESYVLRNHNNLPTPFCKTSLYKESFLPSTINRWNDLPINIRESPTLPSFKRAISPKSPSKPQHLYHGNRKYQVLHLRLRTLCSGLNKHLYDKNIVNSALCHCGSVEDNQHYFFHCPSYDDQRDLLLSVVSQLCTPSVKVLLYGNPMLDLQSNIAIIEAVHQFIKTTKRL
jgi:hypothetical protein